MSLEKLKFLLGVKTLMSPNLNYRQTAPGRQGVNIVNRVCLSDQHDS